MSDEVRDIAVFATKLKDISAKIPFNESLFIFINKLDCEPDVFKEILPVILSE